MIPVDLRQVRYFVAVAEELHFGRAAARLYIAQPALSQAVRNLEESLGVALMNRTSRRVDLTPAGAALLAQAQELLPQFDEMVREAQRVGRGKRGRLRLGLAGNAPCTLASAVIRQFEERHPHIELEFKRVTWAEQTLALHREEIDASLLVLPVDETGLELEVLLTEGRVAAVPAGGALTARSVVTMRDIGRQTQLQPRLSSPRLAAAKPQAAVFDSGRAPGREVESIEEALEHVAQGHGVHVTPASTAALYARPDVSFVPVVDAPPAVIALAWRRADDSRAVRALRELVRELRGSLDEQGIESESAPSV